MLARIGLVVLWYNTFMESFVRLVLYFSLFSIIGYLVETVFCLLQQRRMLNRGFLFGPYLPIYGFGVILITFIGQKTQNNVILTFLVIVVACSALEYITSYFLEKLFKLRWWDYSNKELNINGRVCARDSLAFGFYGCILIYYIVPGFNSLLDQIPIEFEAVLAISLVVVFLFDTIASIYANSKAAKYIIENAKQTGAKIVGDQTHEIKSNAKKAIKKPFTKEERAKRAVKRQTKKQVKRQARQNRKAR